MNEATIRATTAYPSDRDISNFEPEKLAIAEAESQLAALRNTEDELRLEAKHQSTLKAHEQLLADKRTAAQQAMRAER